MTGDLQRERENETDNGSRACTSRATATQETSEKCSPRVTVVIVNYNTADLVIDCLRSVVQEGGVKVMLVDNASPDGSADRLRVAVQENGWGDWVELLVASRNGGFAAGNNVALRHVFASEAMSEYVLLLNPDTVVRPGAIRSLVAFLEAHPRAGIAGSRLENPDGTPQRSAFRFPGMAAEFENGLRLGLVSRLLARFVVAPAVREEEHSAAWVSGASMLVRRAVFEQIGFLDEGYFLYFEEVDFCRRASTAGWECWYVPESRVVHLVGQATGMNNSKQQQRQIPTYWLAARRRYFLKHLGWGRTWLASLGWTLARATWLLRRRLQGKPEQDPPYLLRDFVRYNFLTRHSALSPEVIR
ncbi:MAG: glycosyltransferase family 2 protein [Planctomycetes bacterium]|nr:glycosyltransferase family 2 protein [Planctomycetota bacterium]